MKVIGKLLKILGILLLSRVLLLAAADAAWIYVPQIKAAKRIDDVDAYAAPAEALTVREGAGIIALGEATHGNAEFQRLRRDVLERLTEEYGVRSFALEADFGEAAGVDEYIKGGAGTAAEALNGLSFTIYHTREMEQLIEWMRAYNDGAAEGEKLSFYGFDMQNPDADLRLLSGFCAENGVLDELSAAEKLAALAEDEGAFSALCESADFDIVSAVHDELTDNAAGYDGAEGYEYALHAAECALQAAELARAHAGDDYIKYNNIRDGFMAENVAWISARESAQGRGAIMISGHDGHVAAKAPYYTPMGAHLKKRFGDGYFVIGTDFFKTRCNINSSDGTGRGNHSFCSADPLAAQAKRLGGSYYLDFAGVSEGGETYTLLHSAMTMGSLGEGYTFLMKLLPQSYRTADIPAELYDAMIFVYSASPITLTE